MGSRDVRLIMRKYDMDIVGDCFGLRIIDRSGDEAAKGSPLVELYVEDDERYHYKMSFDAYWLNELIWIANQAKRKTGIDKDKRWENKT